MAGGHCPPAPAGVAPERRSELGRRSAHQSCQHCGALASGYQLEIEELGIAHGVLREEMGSRGVKLFSCFHTLQFGLFFSLLSEFFSFEFLSNLSLGPGCISEKVEASKRCCDTKRCVDGVRAGLLPSPGEEGGTAEFSGARVSLGIPKSSVNSPFPPCPESWGSP